MKKKILVGVLTAISIICCSLGFIGCSSASNTFSISVSADTYYLDKNNEITFSISEKDLSDENKESSIQYYIIGENSCQATIENNKFSATNSGSVVVGAKINTIESSNNVTITVKYSDDYYNTNATEQLAEIFNTAGGVVFGEQYNVGLDSDYASNISIEGADGVFKFGDNGTLDVIGIGQGRVKFANTITGTVLYDSYYAVHNAILCTYIKEDLIEQGKISSTSDIVTNSMLANIKEIFLSGELVNDPTISNALRLLANLETIDLSNNAISDASFLKPLTNLKRVDLSENVLKDISTIVDNQNLEYLDLSNNEINSINKIQFMQKIKYLDLTDNSLTDISPLSSSYGLQSVFLNGNKISNFKDSISGLSNLTELGIGDCGIAFTDIISLKYLSNLTYLDISGTNPNLDTVCNLTKLKTLILKDCKLYDKTLSKLNALTNLEVLDISSNDLLASNYNNALSSSSLTKLTELRIGGNAFTSIPDLTSFTTLKTLDLTASYNLSNLSSVTSLNIETLILDECNTLSATGYLDSIDALTNLKQLSIISGFNYMTKDLYNGLMDRVEAEKFSLRFVSNDYVDKNSISDYEKAVFFTLEEFLTYCQQDTENLNKYTVGQIGNSQQIVLSLINENNVDLMLNIERSLFKLDVYGDVNKIYNVRFNVLERKQSSFTLELHNFNSANNTNETIITSASGSKLNLYSYGKSSLTVNNTDSENAATCISAYDITIMNKDNSGNSKLNITGANAIAIANVAADDTNGKVGYTGGTAIDCNSIRILTGKVAIKGGSGGAGQKGGYQHVPFVGGYKGGDGGTGGTGITYASNLLIDATSTVNGGDGGAAGQGGDGVMYGGSSGNIGQNGAATAKK